MNFTFKANSLKLYSNLPLNSYFHNGFRAIATHFFSIFKYIRQEYWNFRLSQTLPSWRKYFSKKPTKKVALSLFFHLKIRIKIFVNSVFSGAFKKQRNFFSGKFSNAILCNRFDWWDPFGVSSRAASLPKGTKLIHHRNIFYIAGQNLSFEILTQNSILG